MATVSRALNGKEGVSDANRKKIIEASQALGLERPFSSLAAKAGNPFIGYALQRRMGDRIRKGDPIAMRYSFALEKACAKLDHYILLMDVESDISPEGDITPALAGRVAGVVLGVGTDEQLAGLARNGVAAVIYNGYSTAPNTDCITSNYHLAARAQLDHAYHLGHRNVAFFMPNPGPWYAQHCWSEYFFHAKTLELDLPMAFYEPIGFTQGGGQAEVELFLEKVLPHRPTAILTSDAYALHLVEALKARGISVPRDLSLVAMEDTVDPRIFPLTTYRRDFDSIADQTIRALFDRIASPGAPGKHLMVEGELIDRGSCAPPWSR